MTIYQEEMQRKAQHYGCITSYDESDQLLLISRKGVHLTAINPEGFMFYNSKDLTDPESREVFSHLRAKQKDLLDRAANSRFS